MTFDKIRIILPYTCKVLQYKFNNYFDVFFSFTLLYFYIWKIKTFEQKYLEITKF